MAERAAEQVKGYYRSNQATIEQVLGAGRAWRSAEADFVSSTIEYNKAYADYALALPYGQAPVEQVVTMLVVPNNVSPSSAAPYNRGNAQQAQLSRTPSQPASSFRSVPQRRPESPQTGQDSRVRAASNGFGRSSTPQARTQRPLPDFSESQNASAAPAFESPKIPEFRPNSVASPRPNAVASPRPDTVAPQHFNSAASQRPRAASRQDVRPSPTSFGGDSVDPFSSAGARNKASAATGGFQFGGGSAARPAAQPVSRPAAQPVSRPSVPPVTRPAAQQVTGPSVPPVTRPSVPPVTRPAAQPVSQPAVRSQTTPSDSSFGGGKPPTQGFSGGSATRQSQAFGSRANNGLKEPVTDPFASRPSTAKPTTSFGAGGSGTKNAPAGSSARDGFSSGFGR